MNTFQIGRVSDDRMVEYSVDDFGVVNQINPRPYNYDGEYCAIYDTPEYQLGNDQLQAMRVDFLKRSFGEQESVLDFGAGNGAFVRYAQHHFPYVMAYDISGACLPGLNVVSKLEPAYIYTMWDALEHVPSLDILSTLDCHYMGISLPYCHYHTHGGRWMAFEYKHLKFDEHVRHFDPQSLVKALHYYGWDLVALGTHEDIVRKSAHGLANILSATFKRRK